MEVFFRALIYMTFQSFALAQFVKTRSETFGKMMSVGLSTCGDDLLNPKTNVVTAHIYTNAKAAVGH